MSRLHGPTDGELADHDLPEELFDHAARLIASGRSPTAAARFLGLTSGQLAFVQRFTGRPGQLFPPAIQGTLLEEPDADA